MDKYFSKNGGWIIIITIKLYIYFIFMNE
jgi:galactokinase/mevalonate kinase-like predicted kinase